MATARVEQKFDLPAEELWGLIGDFGDTGKWSGRPREACVQEGSGIGSLRTLTIRDGTVIVDRLENETENSYTYSVVDPIGSPLPYKSYRATMTVEPVDEHTSRFIWAGEFEPDGMSDAEASEFTVNVYEMGMGMMQDTIQRNS